MEYEISDDPRQRDEDGEVVTQRPTPANPSKSNVDPKRYAEDHDQAEFIPEQGD